MVNDLYESGIPSDRLDLLSNIEGDTLTNMVRYSWWDLEESTEECEIEKSEVFSLTAGPVGLYFSSGIILGAATEVSPHNCDQNQVVSHILTNKVNIHGA